MLTESAVLDALGSVRDPELDESITSLGFVQSVEVDGAAVDVGLRLPTYHCAPNFSYMMVAEAREAIAGLAGVTHVAVRLVDHHAAGEINAGVAEGAGFSNAFPGQTEEQDLEGLRAIFRGKAFFARLSELCTRLRADGRSLGDLVSMRLADLPACEETRAYLQRRAELGIADGPDEPLLVALDGREIPTQEAPTYLHRARTFATSIESNAWYCRSLLQARYGEEARGVWERRRLD